MPRFACPLFAGSCGSDSLVPAPSPSTHYTTDLTCPLYHEDWASDSIAGTLGPSPWPGETTKPPTAVAPSSNGQPSPAGSMPTPWRAEGRWLGSLWWNSGSGGPGCPPCPYRDICLESEPRQARLWILQLLGIAGLTVLKTPCHTVTFSMFCFALTFGASNTTHMYTACPSGPCWQACGLTYGPPHTTGAIATLPLG